MFRTQFFLELRPEVKVTVTGETVCINIPNLVFSYTSNDTDTIFLELRLEVKNTSWLQDVSTHQIWDSYLK